MIDLPEEDSAVSMKDCYFELEKNCSLETGPYALQADGKHITLVNLGPIVFLVKKCWLVKTRRKQKIL